MTSFENGDPDVLAEMRGGTSSDKRGAFLAIVSEEFAGGKRQNRKKR